MNIVGHIIPLAGRRMQNAACLDGFRRDRIARRVFACLLVCAGLVVHPGVQADSVDPLMRLKQLSLEDLANIEVSTVSKKMQPRSEAAAAIFVITADDIRRTGVNTIADALMLAPGMQVGQISTDTWAVSSRGFNGQFTNKLLVQIDGRSVYSPLFSGVFWDTVDVPLVDIDRIEIVRGPGGTLWGANAVNGVINIITKNAADTLGTRLVASAGSPEDSNLFLRHGMALGEDLNIRVFGKYLNRDSIVEINSVSDHKQWESMQAGARLDWQLDEYNKLSFQGETLQSDTESSTSGENTREASASNLLLRWAHSAAEDSSWTLQSHISRYEHDEGFLKQESGDQFELDWQHRFRFDQRNEIIWGLGYRYDDMGKLTIRHVSGNPNGRIERLPKDSQSLVSAFFQDEISLFDDQFRLMLGAKIEHNDYTGTEVQPNVRGLWQISEEQTFWGAWSRAVRTPSYAETVAAVDVQYFPTGSPIPDGIDLPPGVPLTTLPLPAVAQLQGSENFDSEDVNAFEVGYRQLWGDALSLDMVAFFNIYDSLRTIEPGSVVCDPPNLTLVQCVLPFGSPTGDRFVLPLRGDNKMEGESYGLEVAGIWSISDRWRMQLAYTFLQLDLDPDSDSVDPDALLAEGQSPEHQVSLRLSADLTAKINGDIWLRYADELPTLSAQLKIPSYTTMDARIGWRPRSGIELSLIGRNLLGEHAEFQRELVGSDVLPKIQPSGHLQLDWRF